MSCAKQNRLEDLQGRFKEQISGLQADDSLTALRFDETGLLCAVGTSSGLVSVFDLRSSKPLTVKDHMYSSPIVDLKFKESDHQSGMPCACKTCELASCRFAKRNTTSTSIRPAAFLLYYLSTSVLLEHVPFISTQLKL